jgi:hypothetical protein
MKPSDSYIHRMCPLSAHTRQTKYYQKGAQYKERISEDIKPNQTMTINQPNTKQIQNHLQLIPPEVIAQQSRYSSKYIQTLPLNPPFTYLLVYPQPCRQE